MHGPICRSRLLSYSNECMHYGVIFHTYDMTVNDPLSVKLWAAVIDNTIYAVAKLCLTMHPAFIYGVCQFQ